jgi:acetolactate synthase-1/2/3 large subunit
MKAIQAFLKNIEAHEVEYIFGIPGREAIVFDGLADSNIEFVLTRHEQTAAFMADVYGRLTGKAGVCYATFGPGATNLATGIASAYLDRSPVVAIVAQVESYYFHKSAHQCIDFARLFRPITKKVLMLHKAEQFPWIVNRAFNIAVAERPGPVVIGLPIDILEP